jgi:membrane-associated PAP2 superfamily phosphatase
MSFLDFYRSRDGRRVLLYQAMALAGSAIALSLSLGDGRLDLTIARWFFDDARRIFPLTNDWLLKIVLHDAARTISAVAALALLGIAVTSWVAPRLKGVRAHREALLFTSIATVAAAAIVGALKHFSSHACPWDLAMFGGSAAYHPLLGVGARAPNIDGCFPAAHPLSGYAWLAVGFALYPVVRRSAWLAWAAAFALGTLFGIVQVARGAHFFSHVLWSAWIVWGVNLALLGAAVYWPSRRPAVVRELVVQPAALVVPPKVKRKREARTPPRRGP